MTFWIPPELTLHFTLMNQMSKKQLRQTSTVSSRQIIRELVDTGPCQLHVVHNSFRKGVEGYGSDVENLCIDIYYFFKWSPSRREDYADVQQKLNLDEFVFLWHVQIPAIERVRKQFPALKEYFRKLPDSDKNIAKNARYKRIMTLLTSPETRLWCNFVSWNLWNQSLTNS